MQYGMSRMIGCTIRATDGNLGIVDEFYFDDKTWMIRYIVVETGNWLSGRKVLISPLVFGKPDLESSTIAVTLTCAQVGNSPDIDTERPICRQHEVELNEHYQWPSPSGYGGSFGNIPLPLSAREASAEQESSTPGHPDDPHLRSTRQVTGYHIHATDGEIGHVEDFILDDDSWTIRFLVVDTGNWLPGKKVLLSPQWIDRVEWADSSVHFDLTRESVKNSPEFDPSKPVNRDYEAYLYDHYERPMDHH